LRACKLEKVMDKLNQLFEPSRRVGSDKKYRHIVKDQIIQGDELEVNGVRRSFWSNPNGTHSCHMWNVSQGKVIDQITVDSFDGEDLQEFQLRTQDILWGV